MKVWIAAWALAFVFVSDKASAHELRVVQNSWYNLKDFHQSYLSEHGHSPTFQSYQRDEDLIDFLKTGPYFDIARICSSSLNALLAQNLLRPWDSTRIKDFDTIDDRFLFPDEQNRLYLLPFEFGSNLIVYDPESVPQGDVASLDVFHNPAYQDRISLPDDIASIAALSFLATGVTDWTNATNSQTETALQWWRDAHPNVRYYWDDEDILAKELATGDINLAYATQEIATILEDYDQFAATAPSTREGASLWSCGLVISAQSIAPLEHIYQYANAHFEDPAVRKLLEWDAISTQVSVTLELLGEDDLTALGISDEDAMFLNQSPLPMTVWEKFTMEKRLNQKMP
jgi:spermidine/putrescine transport system substrate-binding protein